MPHIVLVNTVDRYFIINGFTEKEGSWLLNTGAIAMQYSAVDCFPQGF
jgi:hypothetical protein